MNPLQSLVVAEFRNRFGGDPAAVVRAPGRVNLIGEHTDYNDGFVFPMAIERAVWMAVRPRTDRQVVVVSHDFAAEDSFYLDEVAGASPAKHGDARGSASSEGWIEYIKGVAWAFGNARQPLVGWEGVFAGDVPIGAGLSSSAATELAVARAFYECGILEGSGFAWDAPLMATLCQKAENGWVGVNSGIMDQMISAAGVEGAALLIDCRSLATRAAPLPPGTLVVILDTNTRRELVTSAYNERRQQCEAAAAFFGVKKLRDVDESAFAAREAELASHDEVAMRRARHVVTENARTLAAFEAMNAGDAAALGNLMDASHVSMRDDFEITNDALNIMVAIAQAQPGCFGARMTGGGFGGCAVALVAADAVPDFTETVASAYSQQAGRSAAIYVSSPAQGASRVAMA